MMTMARVPPIDPTSEPSVEGMVARMQALEKKMSKRLELLEQRADLLEKIFLFVDIDVLNKAISLATGHQCGAALVPACRAPSLLDVACGLVHRTFLGRHRTGTTEAPRPRKTQNCAKESSAPLVVVKEEVDENEVSLIVAAESGCFNTVSKLISSRADPNAVNPESETALHRAAYNARVDIVELLLSARADPSARDKKGKTPMRRAYDNADIISSLLNARADPNVCDEHGCTTLHASVEDGHVDVIEVLVNARADVNVRNIEEITPLHEAANFGQSESMNALLRARGDANSQDGYGFTPLHFAASGDHLDVANLLIESRANVLVPNEDGETALDIAEQYGKTDLVRLLRTSAFMDNTTVEGSFAISDVA